MGAAEVAMRGDGSLTARLLLRREALPGLGIATGGAALVASSLLPWAETLARVTMLGTSDDRVTAVVRGLPGDPRGWVVAALGVLCLAAGLGAAVDRPPSHATALAGASALLAAGLAVWALLVVRPASTGWVASGPLDLDAHLPAGVELAVATAPGVGPWLAVAGAALILVGVAASRASEAAAAE